MKKIILLLIAFSFIINAQAQRNEIDSLKQLLQNEKTDTGRAKLLNSLSFLYVMSKPDSALTIALQGLELSKHIHFKKGEASSLIGIANAYFTLGIYSKAMDYYLQSLKIQEKINNLNGVSTCLIGIGIVNREQGNYRLAIEYYSKAHELEKKIKKGGRSMSITLGNIAVAYLDMKMFDSALLYAQQSYNLAEMANYSREIGGSLNILGDIHFLTNKYKLALEYCRLSIPHLLVAENYKVLSGAYLTISKIFDKLNQPDSADYYAKQSIAIAKDRGFTMEVRDAARFLSRYYRKYNADSAFFYQDIAAAMNDSLFSQEKQKDLQTQVFDEQLRQSEIAAAALLVKEERNHNLQYAAIAIFIIAFVMLFFAASRSTVVNERFIKFFGILGLLAVFEFINLYIHPILDRITNHNILLMLAILMCIAALLIPLHHRLEKWITHIMVEKNKKIRLEAAHKTIATLSDKN